MASNNISLSQEELDKLFAGKQKEKREIPVKQETRINPKLIFLSEDELQSTKEKLSAITERFKKTIDSIYSDIKTRKMFVTAVSQTSMLDFFEDACDHDFLYAIDISGCKTLLRLDSHLFSALAGMDFDQQRETNMFQTEAMRHLVAAHFADSLIAGHKKTLKAKAEPLMFLTQDNFLENSTGLLVSINWNENFKSFGVEKFFIPKKTFEFLRENKIF
ncbi:MAG: hypothetical protein II921_08935 [Treponema sp.]|nr:hypothetical protein [Treponema sp.]